MPIFRKQNMVILWEILDRAQLMTTVRMAQAALQVGIS
jgi:hypothetical protein